MALDNVLTRWTSIAKEYDQYRLAPPSKLIKIITSLTRKESPDLVVDLGCGTGLSTYPWALVSKMVLGIDPLSEMLSVAKQSNSAKNIDFLQGYGNSTGLDNRSVDIITCNHSIHWMEPESTIIEVARIIKEDGIFVMMGHNFPPLSEFLEVDNEYFRFKKKCDLLISSLNLNKGFFENMVGFAEQLNALGLFKIYREFYFSDEREWSADDYIGWINTQGVVQKLNQLNIDEAEFGLTALKKKIAVCFGEKKCFVMPVWRVIVFKELYQ